MSRSIRQHSNRQSGFSYTEILIGVVLLGLALVPALESLQTASVGSVVTERLLEGQQRVAARMEEVLAEPYSYLKAAADAAGDPKNPTDYSDPEGSPDRVLVYLGLYDGDNADADNNPFTGVDDGLLWVQVEIENTAHSLATLVSR